MKTLKLSEKLTATRIDRPETLKKELMRRKELSAAEADALIESVAEDGHPEEALYDALGIEPDYVFALLD